jgi:simple sugar transport system substrate-binding protein
MSSHFFATTRALLLGIPLVLASCSLALDSSIKKGIGESCVADSDCQAAKCLLSSVSPGDTNGVCSIHCSVDQDCPSPSACVKQQCQMSLSVGVAMTGFPSDLEGWTVAHNDALQATSDALGYLKLEKKLGLTPGNVLNDVKDLASRNRVLVGNTVDYGDDFVAAAKLFPDKKFLVVNDGVRYDYPGRTPNFSTYWVHREQGWYIAGKVAASIGKARLGVISAFINPDTVRDVNAFTLGARSVNPNIVVEVRHMGFWFDINTQPTYFYPKTGKTYYREEYLTQLMFESNVEVIAHIGNTQRSVKLIDQLMAASPTRLPKAWTFANDVKSGCKDSTGSYYPTCSGAIYENWTPIYTRIFDQIHRGVYTASTVEMDVDGTDNTPLGVSINPKGPGDDLATRALIQALARSQNPGPRQRIFVGPYEINGQRDVDVNGLPDSVQKVASGEALSDSERARMCWYVKGVVEKTKLNDPSSPDKDALVPGGLLPGTTTPNTLQGIPPDTEDKIVLPTGLSWKCKENSF